MESVRTHPRSVRYPTSDGKPFSESDWHYEAMAGTLVALQSYFDNRPDVYVSANNFVFWEEGSPKARISPGVYVVFDVPSHLRDCYMAWDESGHLPSFVLEATSRQTRREDMFKKLPLYEQVWKVPECFFFDPKGEYLIPRLQGYRLHNGRYVHLLPVDGRLHSEQLLLDFVEEGAFLRLFDTRRGEFLPTTSRQYRLLGEETRRASEETHARRTAEEEVARLRVELEALRTGRTGTQDT